MKRNKIVAIVPMRHTSERVLGKNYRDFAGKPLFHHIVETLLECNVITKVVVDTDSDVIKEQTKRFFPSVLVFDRPEHLRDGNIPMNNVLMNTCKNIDADFYLQTHCTNPLLKAKTISLALDKFLNDYPVYDSLFSVSKIQHRLWDSLTRPINHNPNILLRTQDLPPTYVENSCLYLFKRDNLEINFNRIGNRPLMYEIDEIEAQDIDVELDFTTAEFLFKQYVKK